MKLHAIKLKNTAHFSDLHFKLNPSQHAITLIVGEQGSGKSSLLKHTYQALTWFQARYKDIRTAGVVMLDQDIQQGYRQSSILIEVEVPEEIQAWANVLSLDSVNTHNIYQWKLNKTFNPDVGMSSSETQQLEHLVMLYQKALKKDPHQGLPLIAYYPAERFINDINLLSKNNPVVFQALHAYDLTAVPFTTFTRFFEWLREISDLEHAQNSRFLQQLLEQPPEQQSSFLNQAHHLNPSLNSLKHSLKTVLPEIDEIFLEHHPKLQIKVVMKGQTLLYQQLCNSLKVWISLVGDIVRRLCILNPNSLYPCLEGEGILLIDQIDRQLDAIHCAEILPRLHQAFPRLQIITTGLRPELFENAMPFQCFKLEHKHLAELQLHSQHVDQKYTEIYSQLFQDSDALESENLTENKTESALEQLLEQIQQQLSIEEQQQLIQQLQQGDSYPTHTPIHD